jgi:hypothetical protein
MVRETVGVCGILIMTMAELETIRSRLVRM